MLTWQCNQSYWDILKIWRGVYNKTGNKNLFSRPKLEGVRARKREIYTYSVNDLQVKQKVRHTKQWKTHISTVLYHNTKIGAVLDSTFIKNRHTYLVHKQTGFWTTKQSPLVFNTPIYLNRIDVGYKNRFDHLYQTRRRRIRLKFTSCIHTSRHLWSYGGDLNRFRKMADTK